ncbi:hypothetical protein LINGRAHAP2_LOCUS31964 [Linum grandiflorum]
MALVQLFRLLCDRKWDVWVKHVYREANVLVDYITSIGHSLTIGNTEMGVRGTLIRYWMEHDMLRISQTRAVVL